MKSTERAAFWPELILAMREGYSGAALRADVMAGLTVAIVALPLSMAIAIASGLGPERGLYTAIVGGALVSALGGSRHQVGGPAGAGASRVSVRAWRGVVALALGRAAGPAPGIPLHCQVMPAAGARLRLRLRDQLLDLRRDADRQLRSC